MSLDTPEIAAARIEADQARARLMDTARELQDRLSPQVLLNGVVTVDPVVVSKVPTKVDRSLIKIDWSGS